MRILRISLLLPLVLALGLAAPSAAATSEYKKNLRVTGFSTLGAPSTSLNSEIVVDFDEDFAYVGSIDLESGNEGQQDLTVKAVDVSDPANPRVTDFQPAVSGDLGSFDVKIAGDVLAASTQGSTASNPGVTLMDISDPADPEPVSHLGVAELGSPDGSHNSYLWQDPLTDRIWLFVTGLDNTSLKLYEVTDPANPVFTAEYNNGAPFVHDNFVQAVDGRVFEYQVGDIGVEILDVTDVVRGDRRGTLTFATDVVAYNHYSSNPADAEAGGVTRPGFAHYVEPTQNGQVTWVGDEDGCGQPGIVRAFDSSHLPAKPGKVLLHEIGTIIEQPDAPMCQGQGEKAQTQIYRWTGHNFDVWKNGLLIRGDYGRGVDVYDISDAADATLVAKRRSLNRGVGEENRSDQGREKTLENYPFVWQAIFDGRYVYASDINQGLYVLELVRR